MLIQALVLAVKAQEIEEFKQTAIKAPFLEQFTDGWDARWSPSAAKKIVDGVEDDELLRYRGEWDAQEPTEKLIPGDKGLLLKSEAAHSAISALLKKPLDPTGKDLVVQYEVNAQNGLECGGAYVKLFTYDPSFKPQELVDSTPYTIMFGPDKCGGNNKVHFIFRHQNPKTKVFEEKHLKAYPPSGIEKGKTSLYTLVVKPDNKFEIFVNQNSVSKGSLLEDFDPSVNPPKEIDDPNDKKPEDWVDEAKIRDPEAKKPADWDEDAPAEIEDPDAVKPDDWLDDAPATIPDPEVKKPEDWDDEEDGDWTAPSVPNPACEVVSGCGKWVRPTIKNPAYKGKWTAPLIDNPAYKGVWAPKKIANPDYFEDKHPANFNKIGAVGFELWSMQSGLLFDNIYIGHSEEDAKELAKESWVIKNGLEKQREPKEEKTPEAPLSDNKYLAELQKLYYKAEEVFDKLKLDAVDFIDFAKEDPVVAVKELPHIAGLIAVLALLPIFVIGSLFSGKPAKIEKPAEKKADKKDDKKKTKKD
ncbi:putative calcium-binding protein precursor cnx1 [Gorgonomyces haynaldii]|nr:putative calcium-binding protein precursor cnx1 [Gorgonomyces haynaldii]